MTNERKLTTELELISLEKIIKKAMIQINGRHPIYLLAINAVRKPGKVYIKGRENLKMKTQTLLFCKGIKKFYSKQRL